jgi:hemerythrin-like domain-containing protein
MSELNGREHASLILDSTVELILREVNSVDHSSNIDTQAIADLIRDAAVELIQLVKTKIPKDHTVAFDFLEAFLDQQLQEIG